MSTYLAANFVACVLLGVALVVDMVCIPGGIYVILSERKILNYLYGLK